MINLPELPSDNIKEDIYQWAFNNGNGIIKIGVADIIDNDVGDVK